jgi:hypothetical protein
MNGLPVTPPVGEACLLSGTTEHAIVFGYANRPPATVFARNCAWDRDGVIRYGGDLRKVTGYWGVRWNQ